MDQEFLFPNIIAFLIYGVLQYYIANFICKKIKNRILKIPTFLAMAFTFGLIGFLITDSLKEKNNFELLNINRTFTKKQLRKSYRKLSLKFHPDKINYQVTD